jgi:alpha-tubulin suppressor-like RCC1 family protein
MSCIDGYCTTGAACDCGNPGKACCDTTPACGNAGYCNAGTCASCVADVGIGRIHTCVVQHDGTVWCVGDNSSQESGGSAPSSATFSQVSDAAGPITNAISVAAGRTHSCVLRADHTVWCWGGNGFGELGNNTTSNSGIAVQVLTGSGTPLGDIYEIGAGGQFACARTDGGAVSCWGANDHGQLGDGTFTNRGYAAPANANGSQITNATSITVGGYDTCEIDSAGVAWCWGLNEHGELGNGGTSDSTQGVSYGQAKQISAGLMHTCVLRPDGTMACSGAGFQYRLGDGTRISSTSPVTVVDRVGGKPFAGALAIAAGGFSGAIGPDHRVVSWGDNNHGQAGNGSGSVVPAAVVIGNDLAVDRLVAHFAHVCAHATDGSWWCWGRNSEGQLADASYQNVGEPTLLAASCR